jgi:hypothetical protein
MSVIRGRHSFKVGGALRYDMYNQVGNQFARGNFQFQNIATGYAFGDFMLGYTQQDEAAVALAVTKFRALSQSYYFTDTWKAGSNMTFDLGLRYEYTPPWFDANGTLMNVDPCHDTTPNVQNLACHPTLVRISSGDVSTGTVSARAEHPGGARWPARRSSHRRRQTELRAAGRLGLEPREKWSLRAAPASSTCRHRRPPLTWRGTCRRRRDNTLLLTPDLTLDAPLGAPVTARLNDCAWRRWCA